ncbi:MAG: ABC transporter ATP-binding protein [Bacteroidales bacterium]|nr:ABC transporter ATP-binding protein [Bacteroidales bacterium]
MKNLIECRNLAIGYKDKNEKEKILFPAIDVSLKEGELTALVGPNGAGKTSLLKTISGNLSQLSGQIIIRNKDLKSYSAGDLAKIISIVLTDRILDQHIKVFDVVATGRYPYTGFWATLDQQDRKMINMSMEMVGIESFNNRTFVTLSDGERQKVMIAKALAQDTPIILLDEPAAFLDYPSKIDLVHLLQSLVNNHKKTILFSSHDLDLTLRTADRLWLVGAALPIKTGIPEQLVLDGFIEKYFVRHGLHFDPEKGQFIQPPAGNKNICLIAKGLKGIWLQNALVRKGWSVNQNEDENIVIQLVNDEIIFRKDLKTESFENIELLLNKLCQNENS